MLNRREDMAKFMSYRAQIRYIIVQHLLQENTVMFFKNHNYSWKVLREINTRNVQEVALGIQDANQYLESLQSS